MRNLFLFVLPLLWCSPLYAYDDPPTPEDIAKWQEAANKGDAEAQYNLGEAYSKGEGVAHDAKEAALWYERAANAGNTEAQFAMGFICRGGEGRPMDKVLSYMWFDIAAKNGDERAYDLRNNVAWSMTEPEIVEARKKAGAWTPTSYTSGADSTK